MRAIGGLFLLVSASLVAEDTGLLNREMPQWLRLGAQMRLRSEGEHGIGYVDGKDRDFLLQRYRFSVGIRPVSGLEFFGELQDSRAAGYAPPNGGVKDRLDLRQAWVGVGSENRLWDLRVGRQRLAYGSERVIGASEWGNTARVFDAAKLSLHRGHDKIDLFASSVVVPDVERWDHHLEGSNLHGAYASIGSLIPGSQVEPFVLFRTNHNAGGSHSWSEGVRSAGTVHKVYKYEAEVIHQTGVIVRRDVTAWAATLQGHRLFPQWRWQPSVMGEANYAGTDFDQLYPTNHGFYGIADQIGRRNTKNLRGGLWLHPERWLTVKAEGHSFWLANRHGSMYAFNGSTLVPAVAGGASTNDIGKEMDLISEVKLSRHYDIGLQWGHLFPGEFLKTYTPGAGHSFYAVYLDLRLQ